MKKVNSCLSTFTCWLYDSVSSSSLRLVSRIHLVVSVNKALTTRLPQHVVFFIGRLIDMMVPDIPEEVQMKMKREHYMAKEALAENQVHQNNRF